jgi:glucose/arabinose dehydrogenase
MEAWRHGGTEARRHRAGEREARGRLDGCEHCCTIAVLATFALACGDDAGNGTPTDTSDMLALEEIASGLNNPTHLTAPTGDDRLFVVEQVGRIRIIADGALQSTPFLDIESKVRSGGEQGLLSVAFHPDYTTNGFFYVNYTNNNGDTRVERYTVSGDPGVADPNSAKLILAVDQPFANHNGGQLAFGLDGMLYIGMGDGGSGGDPFENGQNLSTLLGALLRIDVDAGDPYAIPSDNPFVGDQDVREEIWALGLRNPWRFSFDPADGMLYIGDVGQNSWEEVNAVPAASAARNYGWNIMEGRHCFGAPGCDQSGLTLPVIEYPTTGSSCSVIGGFVYRGTAIPDVEGHYFYSDYCGGFLRGFTLTGGEAMEQTEWMIEDIGPVLSMGKDDAGELYMLAQSGRVYRVVTAQE